MSRYDDYGWRPYVSVAERRRQAEREMQKLKKKGHPVSLYDSLRRLQQPGASRSVTYAEKWGLVPGATYFNEALKDDNDQHGRGRSNLRSPIQAPV